MPTRKAVHARDLLFQGLPGDSQNAFQSISMHLKIMTCKLDVGEMIMKKKEVYNKRDRQIYSAFFAL